MVKTKAMAAPKPPVAPMGKAKGKAKRKAKAQPGGQKRKVDESETEGGPPEQPEELPAEIPNVDWPEEALEMTAVDQATGAISTRERMFLDDILFKVYQVLFYFYLFLKVFLVLLFTLLVFTFLFPLDLVGFLPDIELNLVLYDLYCRFCWTPPNRTFLTLRF